ncbi:MAG: leucyl/phenylalanyl-tRNA--protein transferase family protein [Treponema sp.]|nr:leucyl/phenylalanyl-tRNA--protein transferase family protein [Treponema sp.]
MREPIPGEKAGRNEQTNALNKKRNIPYDRGMYPLRYFPSGHVFIDPADDLDRVVDAMLETDYGEEFCVAGDFDGDFVIRLMEAGFLVMSTDTEDGPGREPFFVLLPKLHLVRSVLFFPKLHVKKSIVGLLSRYELRADADFDLILDNCVATHGADWLTPPLADLLKNLHRRADVRCRPVSFGVYRNGELKAGEIGIVAGRAYTSYSGYYGEANAGTVQMILAARRLERDGFDFLDFGMPLDYKTDLGAENITPRHFVELFRSARRQ